MKETVLNLPREKRKRNKSFKRVRHAHMQDESRFFCWRDDLDPNVHSTDKKSNVNFVGVFIRNAMS